MPYFIEVEDSDWGERWRPKTRRIIITYEWGWKFPYAGVCIYSLVRKDVRKVSPYACDDKKKTYISFHQAVFQFSRITFWSANCAVHRWQVDKWVWITSLNVTLYVDVTADWEMERTQRQQAFEVNHN